TSSPRTKKRALRGCARGSWPAPDRSPSRSDGAPAIQVSDLVFRYSPGGPEVLRGVNVRIEAGEFVALIGQNGAGKTTLAKHFNALLKPTSGTLRGSGRDTRTAPVADLARTVGYVYQNPDHQIFAQRVRAEAA